MFVKSGSKRSALSFCHPSSVKVPMMRGGLTCLGQSGWWVLTSPMTLCQAHRWRGSLCMHEA